jgi:hypothetical protein
MKKMSGLLVGRMSVPRRFLVVLTSVLAAVSLVSLGAVGPAIASSRHVQAGGPLYVKVVKVPIASLPTIASLPRAPRARAHEHQAGPDSIFTDAFEVVNGDGYCLDANDVGSTAGTNGDKVQLWTCSHANNQYWYLGSEDADGSYTVVNDEYTSKCLNANDTGGLADGRHVQLWSCSVDTLNEYWDAATWESCTGYPGADACPLFLDVNAYEFLLDATAQDIGNGDQIQIWTSDGGDNQLWYPYPD